MNHRLTILQQKGKTLSLAVEGRYTNLLIWTRDGNLYMRLDKFKQYSIPLSEKSYQYLNLKFLKKDILKFKFGQKFTNDILVEVINITKDLKEREPLHW